MSPEPTPNPGSESLSDIHPLAAEIATELGETKSAPLGQLHRIVEHCGEAFAREVLAEAKTVEAAGGMKTHDGSRRRTFGGVFFHLARERMTKDQRWTIFWKPRRDAQQRWKERQRQKVAAKFPWDERTKMLEALLKKSGRVTTVAVKIVGRLKHIQQHEDYVRLEVAHELAPVDYPRGVPSPPNARATYTVYADAAQWQQVGDAIEDDREDSLIVEGECAFDPAFEGVTIFATFVSTAALERARKDERRAAKRAEAE